MASVVVTVNTDGGGDYSSLAAALDGAASNITGITPDLVDADGGTTIAMDIVCSGSALDTGQATLNQAGWITDSSHRLRIRAATAGAGPRWSSSVYRLEPSAPYNGGLTVGKALNLDLQDLQVGNSASLDNSPRGILLNNFAWDVRVVGGFTRISGTTGTPELAVGFFHRGQGACSLKMRNHCIAGAPGSGGVVFRLELNGNAGSYLYLYNSTIIDRGSGTAMAFQLSPGHGPARFKNLLLQGGGTNYSMAYQVPDQAVTILSQDTTSPTTALRSKSLSFVDATNWDYHLASGDTAAINVGADLHADSYWAFSTDGDGNSRPNGAWDVGAHEYGAGAPPAGRPAWRNVTRVADRALAAARV